MGVDRLRWKEKQPFYNVLVEDGSCRYAASENLMPAKPQRIIGNPQVNIFSCTQKNLTRKSNILYPINKYLLNFLNIMFLGWQIFC